MISERSYERPWWGRGKVGLVYHGGCRKHGKYPTLYNILIFDFKCLHQGAKRGVEGETSAADRETRKKAKVDLQIMKHKTSQSNSYHIQVDYNEEKSGVKKKGEEGSEDEIQEVRFCLSDQLLEILPGEGGRWQG